MAGLTIRRGSKEVCGAHQMGSGHSRSAAAPSPHKCGGMAASLRGAVSIVSGDNESFSHGTERELKARLAKMGVDDAKLAAFESRSTAVIEKASRRDPRNVAPQARAPERTCVRVPQVASPSRSKAGSPHGRPEEMAAEFSPEMASPSQPSAPRSVIREPTGAQLVNEADELASEHQALRNRVVGKMRAAESGEGALSQLASRFEAQQLGDSAGGPIGRGGKSVQESIKNVIAELEAAKRDAVEKEEFEAAAKLKSHIRNIREELAIYTHTHKQTLSLAEHEQLEALAQQGQAGMAGSPRSPR